MGITENTQDWVGNVVFYLSYGASPWASLCTRLVTWATHGPYVHCEVVIGQNTADEHGFKPFPNAAESRWVTIGAHSSGVKYALLSEDFTDKVWRMASLESVNVDVAGKALVLDQNRLAYALEWARLHLDVEYGTWDIIDQAINFLFPWNKVQITEADHFDCSNFVVAFIEKAGIELPKDFTYPFNDSPNDVAEWFGLLPMRKRIKP